MAKALKIFLGLIFLGLFLLPFGFIPLLDGVRFDIVDASTRLRFYLLKPYNAQSLRQRIEAPSPSWVQERLDEVKKLPSPRFEELTTFMNQFSLQELEEKLLLVRITLVNGEIQTFPKGLKKFQGRLQAVLKALDFLNKEKLLPSHLDFILCVNDKIFESYDGKIPIFAFSKNQDILTEKHLILIPDGMNLSRWAHTEPTICFANFLFPWKNKHDKVVWRGSNTNLIREKAASLPFSFLDAQITDGRNETYIIPELQIENKYLLSLDGISSTWPGFLWKLRSNSLVIKQRSPHVQWYYNGVQAGVHYIDVKADLSDLEECYRWAQAHPMTVQLLVENAQKFTQEWVSYEAMLYYMAKIFQAYTKGS